MSYKINADEFEALARMGFSSNQVRDLCIRLDCKKEGTDDFVEARKVVETVYNTYKANRPKRRIKSSKKQGKFSIGSYKYKSK